MTNYSPAVLKLLSQRDELQVEIWEQNEKYDREKLRRRHELRYHAKNRRIARSHKVRSEKIGANGSFTPDEWESLKSQFGYCCADCGIREAELLRSDFTGLTVGHAVPLSRGGSNDIGNIIPQCRSCNAKQGTRVQFCPRLLGERDLGSGGKSSQIGSLPSCLNQLVGLAPCS